MTGQRLQMGWVFDLWWALASSVGFAGIFAAVLCLLLHPGASGVWVAIGAAVGGAAVGGVMQWLVLRRKVSHAGWWVLVGIAGWLVSVLVAPIVQLAALERAAHFIFERTGHLPRPSWIEVWTTAGATVGAVVGTVQWLLLRRKASRAGWWILASTFGYAVNLAVAVGVHKVLFWMWARAYLVHFSYEGSGAVGGAAGGAAYGAISGMVLVRLFRRPPPRVAVSAHESAHESADVSAHTEEQRPCPLG